MDLTLSRKGDYAVRAAIALANVDGGEYLKIREVAAAMEIPVTFTPQVLSALAHAGLAEAKAGPRGGYRLTRSPSEITMLEIVEAAEGQLLSERCPLRGGPCRWEAVCAVHPTWVKASESIRATLANDSLAAVAEADRRLQRRGRRAAAKNQPTPR